MNTLPSIFLLQLIFANKKVSLNMCIGDKPRGCNDNLENPILQHIEAADLSVGDAESGK